MSLKASVVMFSLLQVKLTAALLARHRLADRRGAQLPNYVSWWLSARSGVLPGVIASAVFYGYSMSCEKSRTLTKMFGALLGVVLSGPLLCVLGKTECMHRAIVLALGLSVVEGFWNELE